jgi:hypothetical protein
MNLGKLMESSIQDLDWLSNPQTYDVSRHYKPNDVVRELELQWGDGSSTVQEMPEPVQVVEPREEENPDNLVVSSAKRLIASGRSGLDVVDRLNEKYGSEAVKGSVKDLRSSFELDGVAGCFAVDCSGFSSCREALEHAQKSPYKRFLSFVVNHDEGKSCHRSSRQVMSSSGGSFDSMLSDDKIVSSKNAYCDEIGLPILSYDGIAPEYTDKTIIDLMSLGKISEDDVVQINATQQTPFKRLREAFRRAIRNDYVAGRKSYSEKIDASDHKVVSGEFGIELAEKMVVQPPVEVDTVDHKSNRCIELDSDISFGSIDVDASGKMSDVDIFASFNELSDIDPSGPSFGKPLDVNDEVGFVAQNVDRGDGKLSLFDLDDEVSFDPQQDVNGVYSRVDDIDVDNFSGVDVNPVSDLLFNIEVNDEMDLSDLDVDEKCCGQEAEVCGEFVGQDVEMDQFMDDEFVGSDIIEVDQESPRNNDLDVDGRSNFSF